jgi:hypothetical protein
MRFVAASSEEDIDYQTIKRIESDEQNLVLANKTDSVRGKFPIYKSPIINFIILILFVSLVLFVRLNSSCNRHYFRYFFMAS